MAAFMETGGEILSIVDFENENKEYIWVGDKKYWDGHGPNLFPIVGRVKEGKYVYNGKEYSIKSPHGFVWISKLNIYSYSDNSITFNLKSNTETKKSYPFDFDYYVKYTLIDKKVIVSYTVINTSDTEDLIFALGAHPGFNVPLNKDEKFEDYYLEFGEKCTPDEIICKEAFLTGETRPYELEDGKILRLRHNLFDNDAILLQNHAKKVTIRSDKSERGVSVTFPDFKYLGIWHTNKTDAPFVCIEPWNGVPSLLEAEENLETKYDMMKLSPNNKYEASFEIEVF